MDIGVPKEIKNSEKRVGLTPQSVQELTDRGHSVTVETNAGMGIGASDEDYKGSGASIANSASVIFDTSDMIVKVKEPQADERAQLRDGQILFTYLHLAPDPEQTKDLMDSKAICIAYETVTNDAGELPLLAPMSKVAGRMSIQAGAHCLEATQGGAGLLLGGVAGVPPAKVVVIGGGVVGEHAVQMAVGQGAHVTVFDRLIPVLDDLSARFGSAVETVYSTKAALEDAVIDADLVIGAVLVKGAKAPKLVTAEMIRAMKPGSCVVDVAIDQGGCMETSKPTTHTEPTYIIDDVVHYCVANMPGGVPKTSTYALNNATLPFVIKIADKGAEKAMAEDPHLLNGLNVYKGVITEREVAEALGLEYGDPKTLLVI